MRWLLLSDLHIGHDNEEQRVALMSLVEDIREQAGASSFDMVMLAGDLAYSGKQAEYETLAKDVINPLREMSSFREASFIAVPGNHDVDCDRGYPPTVDALGPKRSGIFFHMDEDGKKLREAAAECLSAYSDFLKKEKVKGVDPIASPACLLEYESSSASIQVLCVVTTFFSSKYLANERHQVPAPIHPIRQLLTSGNREALTIILGHHPVTWFTQESTRHLESLLVDNNAVYIHGHEHRIQAAFGSRGLTSLGFGAVYQAPLGAPPTPYYRNSFAICEIDASLHIHFRTWDSENGRWINENNLPANFDRSSNILQDGRVLPLPTTLLRDHGLTVGAGTLIGVSPMVSHLRECFWLAEDKRVRWLRILEEIGIIDGGLQVFEPPTSRLAEGHMELRIKENGGSNCLIHAVSAHGDVFSYDQAVILNTLLDTESLSRCLIITLGELADETKTLINRLGATKKIEAIDQQELIRLWLTRSTSPLVSFVKSLDVATVSATLVITEDGYALVLTDTLKNSWFCVVNNQGIPIAESDSLVNALRSSNPALEDLAYTQEIQDWSPPGAMDRSSHELPGPSFDRKRYLEVAYDLFDEVRYAPLAALGIRFKSTSLSEIYIPTNADVAGDLKTDQSLQRAVSEYLETFDLDPSLRSQLESQLRSQYGLARSAEVGVARKLYQRYGNVILLGDPGSGKTCFVKFEMLAYCKPPSDNGSWYRKHLPIYVPLAEAAELLRTDSNFFSVCTTIAARQQLELPRQTIVDHLSDGKAAFFFDGLDEVSRIEERVNILSKIDELVSKYAAYGNRFVVTSRPAAVQPVDIPAAFKYLHLKGLTDSEIQILAERILSTRLGAPEEDRVVRPEEREIVEKLLVHVKETPGLRRISRNPLLLTLLVLIYANTGALSARRHVVYTQAVKTLVTVRHREAREKVLSETDLRTHLGNLAYAIYRREIGELPTRREVLGVLTGHRSSGSSTATVGNKEAEEFIRRVAEATGLLAIHPRSMADGPDHDVISFMHYSFLEYYAAVGFLANDFEELVPRLATNPHWRDVITLLFGIRSEQCDVTSLLRKLIEFESDTEPITQERMILAFDCALECDVPPQETQRMLAQQVERSLTAGVLKYSEFLRKKIAGFVDQLIASSGMGFFEEMLVVGVGAEDGTVAAAHIDFMGRLKEPERFEERLVDAFENAFCGRRESVVRASCAGALTRRVELRTTAVLAELERCLTRSILEKHSAITAIEIAPELGAGIQSSIVSLLDDPHRLISSSAARCVLVSEFVDPHSRTSEASMGKALRIWQDDMRDLNVDSVKMSLDGVDLQRLLESDRINDIELGARLLPIGDMDDKQVYAQLMAILRRDIGHGLARACLDSLRTREGALDLVTLADTDLICRMVESKHRDVRIGTVKVLAMLPNDEQVINTLLLHCGLVDGGRSVDIGDTEEEEGFAALAEHARKDPKLQSRLASAVLSSLPGPTERRFGDERRQKRMKSLLLACEKAGAIVEVRLSRRLLDLVNNFRTPSALRVQSLRTYGRTVQPSVECVGELVKLVEKDEQPLNEAAYTACFLFLGQCRKRVDFVRIVYSELGDLRRALVEAWWREKRRLGDRIDAASLEDIRRSLNELESLLISYKDFSERMKLKQST